MFPRASTTLLLSISIALIVVDAGPVGRTTSNVTLTLVTRTTFNEHGNQTFTDVDLARAQAHALQERDDKVGSLNVNNQNFHCTVDIDIGVEPRKTSYKVKIDTGSSFTWVVQKAYVETDTSFDTGKTFGTTYANKDITGEMYEDTVTLGDLVIRKQSIGIPNVSVKPPRPGLEDQSDYKGILGLGPVAGTEGRVSDKQPVPTVMDNLVAQGLISKKVLGVYFVPSTERDTQGALTFGGFDGSVIPTGKSMHYFPATKIFSAGMYLGIEPSITYGHETIMSSNVGIIDTGTTLVMLPADAFSEYKKMTGATLDDTTGMLMITPEQYANLQDLTFKLFKIGGEELEFTLIPDAQIWPPSQNNLLPVAGESDKIYLIVHELTEAAAQRVGYHFILGYTFIERFYTVFDIKNRMVGLAETRFTHAKINY